MEGSRHEKAGITLAAYVIGFVTAFILYGNFEANTEVVEYIGTNNAASVAGALQNQEAVAEEKLVVNYGEGRLEVSIGEKSNLLSFNPETSGIESDISELSQGFHFGEITYQVSPNEDFVFFCEQHNTEETSCNGLVYDVNAQVIHPLIKNGSAVVVSESSLADVTWTSEGLVIGQNRSVNKNAPWMIVSVVDASIDLQ